MNWIDVALFVALMTLSRGAWAQDALLEQGKNVNERWGAICHGPGFPGTVALQAQYNGSKPALLDPRTDLSPP